MVGIPFYFRRTGEPPRRCNRHPGVLVLPTGTQSSGESIKHVEFVDLSPSPRRRGRVIVVMPALALWPCIVELRWLYGKRLLHTLVCAQSKASDTDYRRKENCQGHGVNNPSRHTFPFRPSRTATEIRASAKIATSFLVRVQWMRLTAQGWRQCAAKALHRRKR